MAKHEKVDEVKLFFDLMDIIRKQNSIIDNLYCLCVQYEGVEEEEKKIQIVADKLKALGIAEETTGGAAR